MTPPLALLRSRVASPLIARRLSVWLLSATALLGLASCEGASGDVCQLDGDCETGLVCCKGSASLTDRGVCAASCLAVDAGARDLGAADAGADDLGADDAGEPIDLAMSVDLGDDAGAEDAGAVDSGAVDSGVGAEDAGAADAGEGAADLGAASDLGASGDAGLSGDGDAGA